MAAVVILFSREEEEERATEAAAYELKGIKGLCFPRSEILQSGGGVGRGSFILTSLRLINLPTVQCRYKISSVRSPLANPPPPHILKAHQV